MRPRSIRLYELCYLGAVLASMAVTAITWRDTTSSSDIKQIQTTLGSAIVPIFCVFVYTVALALWYFTARVPNAFAKWVVTVFFVLSVIWWGVSAATGPLPLNAAGLIAVIGLALNAAAVWFLFRPDARTWSERRA